MRLLHFAAAPALVIAWPVLRALWWWTPEIGLSLGLVTGWVDLADHTILPIRLAVVVFITGAPTAIPQVRRRLVATVWCLITRHRIPDLLHRIHHHKPHRQPRLGTRI